MFSLLSNFTKKKKKKPESVTMKKKEIRKTAIRIGVNKKNKIERVNTETYNKMRLSEL